MEILWVLLLQLLGTAAIIAEIIVPSFGALTVMALTSFGFSYYQLYLYEPQYIPIMIIVNIFSIPATLLVAVKVLGKSKLSLDKQLKESVTVEYPCEVGETGTAFTALRPAGKIEVDGKLIDVISTGDFVDKGSAVKVSSIDNTGIRVVVIDSIETVETV